MAVGPKRPNLKQFREPLLGALKGPWSHQGSSRTIFFFFLMYLFFLAVPRGMQDLSSPARDGTHTPCSGSAES